MAFIIQESRRRRNNRSATKVKLFCNCPFVTALLENFFFLLAFQCIIVIHLTIASVVSLVAVSNNNNEQVQFSSFQKGAGA